MIWVRQVHDALLRKLEAYAMRAGLRLSRLLVRQPRKIARPSMPEGLAERLRQREPYRGKRSPTQVLREERDRGR